jgi:hypothetical protein
VAKTFEFTDTEFMSAAEKRKVLKQWETFLKFGCMAEHFTHTLYHHLIQHCEFIAHYDRGGFYQTYFVNGDDRVHFFSQFDSRNGIPASIEYGGDRWMEDEHYSDINIAMCEVAKPYLPVLLQESQDSQRHKDYALAKALLAKHGYALKIAE